MNLFRITLGDFSSDGHGITTEHYVTFKEEIDPIILFENYNRNVEKFGFSLGDFADNYEDNSMSNDKWDTLVSAGMVPWELEYQEDYGDELNKHLQEEDVIKIVMFFYTHGLNVEWEPHILDAINLTGNYGRPSERRGAGTVGYGLYSP